MPVQNSRTPDMTVPLSDVLPEPHWELTGHHRVSVSPEDEEPEHHRVSVSPGEDEEPEQRGAEGDLSSKFGCTEKAQL